MPEPWFSKVAETCIGADVLVQWGVVCNSKEQLDLYFVRNSQSAAFQRIVFYRRCVRNEGFLSNRVIHCDAVSHSEFLPYSSYVLSVVNGARTWVFKGSRELHWR